MGASDYIEVEVVYAERDVQTLRTLRVPVGTSVGEALRLSGLPSLEHGPDLLVGIFGSRCTPEKVLAPGDRVEVYRPLVDDPKTIRRRRARSGRAKPS